jgi:hypothetical protein
MNDFSIMDNGNIGQPSVEGFLPGGRGRDKPEVSGTGFGSCLGRAVVESGLGRGPWDEMKLRILDVPRCGGGLLAHGVLTWLVPLRPMARVV